MLKGHSLSATATKPAVIPSTTSPGVLNTNEKKEDGDKMEDTSLSFDQLLPDSASRLVIGPFLLWQTTALVEHVSSSVDLT